MNEAIQRIIEAAKGENPEAILTQILDHERKAAADQARGVEDVTAGLKSTLDKLKAELAEKKTEAEAKAKELEKLKSEAEAKAHGVDDETVNKLAEKRAEAMAERAVQTAQAETARVQGLLDAATKDNAHLVDRLETAYVDINLGESGIDGVSKLFYPLLRDKVRPYLKVDEDIEGEGAWWRRGADKPPRFAVVNPDDPKTRLTGKSGPMKLAELVGDKKVGEWSDFWPRNDRGPGGSTHPANGGGGRQKLDPMATPGLTLLEDALFSKGT